MAVKNFNNIYRFEQVRLESFVNWRVPYQDPAKLAAAGFIYLGTEDQVKCFHCKSVMGNWRPNDDPRTVHLKYGGDCKFIRGIPCGNIPLRDSPFRFPSVTAGQASTWQYRNPHSLATSGISTQNDLDELRGHIMFPVERPAVLIPAARGIAGEPTVMQGRSISNFRDDASMTKIIQSTWEKIWGYLSTLKNINAGLIGVLLFCRIIILIFDTIMNGWSIYRLGAMWDSVTNLLWHLSHRSSNSGKSEKSNGEPTFFGRKGEKSVYEKYKREKSDEHPLNDVVVIYNARESENKETNQSEPASSWNPPTLQPFPENCLPSQYNSYFIKSQLPQPQSINQSIDHNQSSYVWATETPNASQYIVAAASSAEKCKAKNVKITDPTTSDHTGESSKVYLDLRPDPSVSTDHSQDGKKSDIP